ncbi:glycoside hydrolase family 2 TIM barrel-domain containing protein [Streptomyces sp. NPDC090303]|uniref:glycoside hydrolase family 2 TIM barrel-domain containing protein n=1 Tax=Streptomyces sp. NPDC090303 TaxID=3365960 RepID=UPI0037FDD125
MRRPTIGACAAISALVVGFMAPPVFAAPVALSHTFTARETPADTVFGDDFSGGLEHWTKTRTPAGGADWTVRDGALSVDTTAAATGSYLRPSGALTLPGAYELTTRVRVDEIRADGTVSFVMDMQDADTPTTRDIAAQITGTKPDGRAGVQVTAPLAGSVTCAGDSPVTTGDWLDVRIVRAGGVTAVYLGGRLVASETSPAAGGTFALGSYRSRIAVGPVTVRSLPATPAGHPTSARGCTFTAPDQDAPGHQVTRGNPTQSLDGDWNFKTENAAAPVDPVTLSAPGADTAGWDSLPVPGNWDTRDAYNNYRGVAWYQRSFTVMHPGDADARYWLTFDACYRTCQVWVNGKPVKSLALKDASNDADNGKDGTGLVWSESDTHTGGYTRFQLDVTSALRTSGTNTVVVKADNTVTTGAWYPWGGLSREVSLTTTQPLSATRQEITATPNLSDGTASVTSRVFVRNSGSTDQQVTVDGSLTSAATGADVPGATGLTGTATVPAGQTVPVTLHADLDADTYSLWRLDDPELYRLDASLTAGTAPGTVVNAISDAFGIRQLKIDGTDMLLNGEKLKVAGANRVSDDPVNGSTEPVAQVRHDLDMMKAAGMSVSRLMHYAQAPAVLDYADRIGMLIIGETPVWGDAANLTTALPNIKQQMAEQVQKDFNHPSVFAWSVGNELASHTEAGRTYDRRMAAFSKKIDPSRFVTQVNNKINESSKVPCAAGETNCGAKDGTQYMDFAAINLYGNFDGGVQWAHKLYPTKPMFISEYSTDMRFSSQGGYLTSQESLDQKTTTGDRAQSYFANKDYLFGWSQWTYNDYRSTYADSSPNKVRGYGDVDVWGRPKASYGAVQAANAPVRSIAVAGVQNNAGTDETVVTVTPRGPLATAGPSWTLSGYKLAVRVTGADGKVVGGALVDLPEIDPGDAALRVPVAWKHSDDAAQVRVSLLSPAGFQEAVSFKDLKAPAKPEITGTSVANGSVRVRFDDGVEGLKHTVKATAPDGSVAATTSTYEPYADLTGLTNGTEYTVSVTTDNTAGSSAPATTGLTPGGTLPYGPNPVKVVPVDQGLVLGFTETGDAAGAQRNGTFQVTATDTATGAVVKDYRTTNRPGTRLEDLTPGHTYALRIRRLNSDGTASTAWSEKVEGTVPGADQAPALKVMGTIGGPTSGAIALTPAPGTVRYEVSVAGGTPFQVNRSATDLIPLTHLKPGTSYSVSVKAVGAKGSSAAWNGDLTTTQAPAADARITGEQGSRSLSWTAPAPAPAFYNVYRTVCGTTTTTKVAGGTTRFALADDGGSYSVRAGTGAVLSTATTPVGTGGATACGTVVGPADTTAGSDGIRPFSTTGTWSPSTLTTPDGYPSVYADHASSPAPRAVWTAPAKATASRLTIEVALPGGSGATSVTYTISTAGGSRTRTIDQNTAGPGWISLGTYDFAAGQAPKVSITAATGGFVRASAVQFSDAG